MGWPFQPWHRFKVGGSYPFRKLPVGVIFCEADHIFTGLFDILTNPLEYYLKLEDNCMVKLAPEGPQGELVETGAVQVLANIEEEMVIIDLSQKKKKAKKAAAN